jgi:UDP-GlcNAc3NAcA epimerase
MSPPRYRFEIGSGGHAAITAEMLRNIEGVLVAERPDGVIVYGDTNSTLAGALAAAKLGIRLVHVEAGLRSFNRSMPEEINRVVTDHVSDLLLCPTRAAVENLSREGLVRGVHKVGDLMYDATVAAIPIAERQSSVLEKMALSPGGYGVVTIHRAGNTDDPRKLSELVSYIADQARVLPLVFPVHPRTATALEKAGLSEFRSSILATQPLGYLDMCKLLHHAKVIFTDSGGLQKEAYFHGVPCVTLRDETEWIETVESGWNRLWKSDSYRQRRDIPDYGHGRAAHEIVEVLRNSF